MCPVEAIYYEDDVPEEWSQYYTANVDFFAEIGSPGGASRMGPLNFDHPIMPPRYRHRWSNSAFLDARAYQAAYFLVISYLADKVNPDSFIDHHAHISRAKLDEAWTPFRRPFK